MKRMTTTLLAAALAGGTLGAATAAFAETTIYGSVRSGVIHYGSHGGTKASWDIGSVDAGSVHTHEDTARPDAVGDIGERGDKLWSRIGVRASHDLGNGMTGGLHIEKRLDNFRTRHQNVWLGGPFGRVTLGQQGSPYFSAVSWDGVNFFGGLADPGSRRAGITYKTMFDGPFSFAMGIGDDATKQKGSGSGVDGYELAASYTAGGIATVSLGYQGVDSEEPTSLDYAIGGTVGGSVANLSWKVGYQSRDYNSNADEKYYGFHLGYRFGDGNLYGQYEDLNADGSEGDDDSLIFGYAHYLGDSTAVILEHQRPDDGVNRTALGLRVNF